MKGFRRSLAGFVAAGMAASLAIAPAVAEDDDDGGWRGSKQVFERISTKDLERVELPW